MVFWQTSNESQADAVQCVCACGGIFQTQRSTEHQWRHTVFKINFAFGEIRHATHIPTLSWLVSTLAFAALPQVPPTLDNS